MPRLASTYRYSRSTTTIISSRLSTTRSNSRSLSSARFRSVMPREMDTTYSRSSCTRRKFTSTGNVVPSFRRCTVSMIASRLPHCAAPADPTFVGVRIDVMNCHRQKLFPAIPQLGARLLIHIEKTQCLRIHYVDGIVRLVQQCPEQSQIEERLLPLPRRLQQLFVARAQRLLRPHPFRDVMRDPPHNRRLHSFGAQRAVILQIRCSPDRVTTANRPRDSPVRSISRK